jgi:hypothetical protein
MSFLEGFVSGMALNHRTQDISSISRRVSSIKRADSVFSNNLPPYWSMIYISRPHASSLLLGHKSGAPHWGRISLTPNCPAGRYTIARSPTTSPIPCALWVTSPIPCALWVKHLAGLFSSPTPLPPMIQSPSFSVSLFRLIPGDD